MTDVAIRCLTAGPRHHFFGFHDLPVTSRKSGDYLGLSVERIDRPPLGKDRADVIVWSARDGAAFASARILCATGHYNFPQGARQQWLGNADIVAVNEGNTSERAVTGFYDAQTGCRIGQISMSSYCITSDGGLSFTVDFGRLHRLGGYGHAATLDKTPAETQPSTNGIFVTDIAGDKTWLLLSIREMADLAGLDPTSNSHVFITHLRINPDETRLAFLLRYRLSDGGEETCLCTIGINGEGARILSRGFLSHFDWIADDRLIVWGRRSSAVASIRRHPMLSNPLARAILPFVKVPLRAVMGRSKAMSMSYLEVTDADPANVEPFAVGILKADGHPMQNPVYKNLLVTDTYPDLTGIRDLMLFDLSTRRRYDLGRFPMIADKPSTTVTKDTAEHIRSNLSVQFDADVYAFTRSGLHCDLHPRWTSCGRKVVFDSIHDGTRQIYAVDIGHLLATPQGDLA